MVPLRQSFRPSNFGDHTIQVRTNTMHFPTEHPESTPLRRSVLREEKEAEQMLAWKYVLVPILQSKLRGRVGIKTHITILGGPLTKGDKIRIDCLTPAFSGAQKMEEMLHHPAFSGVPKQGTQSEVKTYTRGNSNAPSISKYGSLVWPNDQIVAPHAHCAKCAP